MNWKHKALMMKVLSGVSFGAQIHYLIQRYVVKSLPSSPEKIQEYIIYAQAHLGAFRRHGQEPINSAQFYEFGAGRDFVIPFAMAQEGVGLQTVMDIKPLAEADLMKGVIAFLYFEPHGWEYLKELDSPHELARMYGINYIAPCDARATGLADESFDFITSTNVLEHIPAVDIPAILTECHRILRPGGVMSFRIDYDDHYSKVDTSIPPWHFHGYSERQWKKYNSALHYQNRLVHDNYITMCRQAGFMVVEEHFDSTNGWTHNAQIVMTKGENNA